MWNKISKSRQQDIIVIACGILVHKALEAAEQMAERGVSVRVVDMYSIMLILLAKVLA